MFYCTDDTQNQGCQNVNKKEIAFLKTFKI